MQPEDEAFVGACTHVNETDEWTASCGRRIPWLRASHEHGLRVLVALIDDRHVGFLYMMPIEHAAWGLEGHDLMVIQCLVVRSEAGNRGVGKSLISAAVDEARRQGKKGVVVMAYYHDFWFMPAPFFDRCGFSLVKREGTSALLWRVLDEAAQAPEFLRRRYTFTPVQGKVVVDLFWTRCCLTTDTEAERVREVAAEFGNSVVLREYCSDDPQVRSGYGVCRAIFIDGKEVGWGYEAPKDGLREAIRGAMVKQKAP
jgi:predicted N-acetyltransferase YhbS